MSTLTTTLLTLILSVPVAPHSPVEGLQGDPVPHAISTEKWVVEEGDKILVDTKNNEGYIFHKDGQYLNFPLVTGQRRWVSYIGRYYNASTPNWSWAIKTMHIKGDRLTFGPSGRFLRLYKDGSEHTAYGFHEYGQEDEIFEGLDTRFRSMGCIIVRIPIMDILVNTFEKNESIEVISQHGIDNLQEAMLAFEKDEEDLEDSAEVALY
jgi:hypothetical protein|tara:strand:+ start:308 stop:931 length:624 start_codon:yes stop_codon:yes gene_type:complete